MFEQKVAWLIISIIYDCIYFLMDNFVRINVINKQHRFHKHLVELSKKNFKKYISFQLGKKSNFCHQSKFGKLQPDCVFLWYFKLRYLIKKIHTLKYLRSVVGREQSL